MLLAVIDSSRKPRPTSRAVKRGSPATSPQMLIGMRARTAAALANWISRRTRRVERIVEVGDVLVAAVDGQRVHRQVVGADGEKVADMGQGIGGQRGAGHLDHGPERRQRVRGCARCADADAARRERAGRGRSRIS